MNNQHTPGPWQYDGQVCIHAPSGTTPTALVALVYSCGTGKLESNGRLIAAAPVMLDELQHSALVFGEILDSISDGDVQSARHAAERALDTIRAAIAKAEGQS